MIENNKNNNKKNTRGHGRHSLLSHERKALGFKEKKKNV